MVIRSINLETVCGVTSTLPVNGRPEVAFAGKSNVGKSSLINALVNRKSYARTSATPGKTQTINFYNINGEMYLHGSKQLKAVFLLIDIRHEPSANDRLMYEWVVNQGFEPVIIATKLDKIKRSQIQKHVKMLREGLSLVPGTKVIPFSSVTKQGRYEIWEFIERVCLEQGGAAQDGE